MSPGVICVSLPRRRKSAQVLGLALLTVVWQGLEVGGQRAADDAERSVEALG